MVLNKAYAAVDRSVTIVRFMQVNDVHHISLDQSNYNPREVPSADMHSSQNLSVLLTIRNRKHKTKATPASSCPTCCCRNSNCSICYYEYDVQPYSHTHILHDNLHELDNVAPAVRHKLCSDEENNINVIAVWLSQLAELAGKGTSDYVVE